MPDPAPKTLRLDQLHLAPQPRTEFSEKEMSELAASIREHGVLNPILVRWDGEKYVVADGERRVLAASAAELVEVPIVVLEGDFTPPEVTVKQLVANVQRSDLRPRELARALQGLKRDSGLSTTELARKLGLSASKVSRALGLLQLPTEIQEKVERGELPASVAAEIGKENNLTKRADMMERALSGKVTRDVLAGRRRAGPASLEQTLGVPMALPDDRVMKVALPLDSRRRVISLSGPGLDSLERAIAWVEELLGRLRKGRAQGYSLSTLARTMRDQARAPARALPVKQEDVDSPHAPAA